MLSLEKPVKRIALLHMTINLFVVALYVLNAWLRTGQDAPFSPVWLSAAGVALLTVSGWLGGKMVYAHGVDSQAVRVSPGRALR